MEKIKCIFENKVLTVRIIGDIDHHSARGVREKIDYIIFDKKPILVLLDLSAVEFMDSSGLGLILGRYTISKDIGADFKIIRPSSNVKRILDLAGIDRLMKIEGDDNNEAC
ncbi:MAG: anti-sigma factor antagonist [Clostridia bacterium]|nr:anti-sigma factor antagonist [Clostridia bacterium]